MGRLPRFHFVGAVYHVMARGVDRRDIFIDDIDRFDFIERLRIIEENSGASVLAHCLMGNHFHLAIRVGRAPLSSIMHRLLSRYGRRFNFRHGRVGHLFQNRYQALLCMDERYLARLIPYIHMNPVRAGLVNAPWEWPWSSFKGTAPLADDLSDFDPWPKEGTRDFDLIRNGQQAQQGLDEIGEKIQRETGFELEDLRAHRYGRALIAARRRFVEDSIQAGHSQHSIATWLSSTRSAISRFASKVGSGRPDTKL